MTKILVLTPTLGNRISLHRTIESVKQIGGNNVRHIIVCPQHAISKIIDIYDLNDIIDKSMEIYVKKMTEK